MAHVANKKGSQLSESLYLKSGGWCTTLELIFYQK